MTKTSSNSESELGSSTSTYKRKDRKARSSSTDSDSDTKKRTSRHGSWSRGSSPSKGSRRRNRSRSSSLSSKRNSPKRKSRHSRSTSRSRRKSRSRSRSRKGYKSQRKSRSTSRSSKNKRNRRHSKSSSPSRSRTQSTSKMDQHLEKDTDPLKQKIMQAAKAAAIADAELREKGLLKEGSEGNSTSVTTSIASQIQRTQTIDEINAPSFVQHRFSSSRSQTTKGTSQKSSDDAHDADVHMAAIFGLAAPKLGVNPLTVDASIKKLETWKENPEMLVHESLFVDQVGKQERWLKKLLVMRKKILNEEV